MVDFCPPCGGTALGAPAGGPPGGSRSRGKCGRAGDPKIEELTLEYLDKKDRVRLQIEALRDVLGTDFRLGPYPAALHRPHLAVWGNATHCVVAAKHDQGGFQLMADADLRQV